MSETNEKQMIDIRKDFEELNKIFSEEKYINQTYPEGAKVEISGELFTKMIASIHTGLSFIQHVDTASKNFLRNIQNISPQLHTMQLDILNQHVENIDKGLTVKEEVEETQEESK
jgi:hypothetical protein